MKLKTLFASIILIVCLQTTGFSQIYKTNSGKVPLSFKMIIGDIHAVTHKAKSVVNISSKFVKVIIPVSSFSFDNPFVEDQFKKTYMEMDKYPETVFSGYTLQDINLHSSNPQKIQVKGYLSMHGIKKPRTIPAVVTVLDGGKRIKVTSTFKVKASEHKINVPISAFQNNDDRIEINLDAEYLEML